MILAIFRLSGIKPMAVKWRIKYLRHWLHVLHHFLPTASYVERKKTRARPGFEPGTSRTQSENHTPRPTGLDNNYRLFYSTSSELQLRVTVIHILSCTFSIEMHYLLVWVRQSTISPIVYYSCNSLVVGLTTCHVETPPSEWLYWIRFRFFWI